MFNVLSISLLRTPFLFNYFQTIDTQREEREREIACKLKKRDSNNNICAHSNIVTEKYASDLTKYIFEQFIKLGFNKLL